MAAPTSLTVSTDRKEYSLYEHDRDTLTITVTAEGSNLQGEQVLLEIVKARFARDVVVASLTTDLVKNTPHSVAESVFLPEIVNEKQVYKMRRGYYFVRATSVTNTSVTAESADFRTSLVTVNRLQNDFLHGTDQFASDLLGVVDQPQDITGVTVSSVARGHTMGPQTLSYNYAVDTPPTVTGVTTAPFALADGQTLVLQINGSDEYTATFNTADFGAIGAATAAEVAAVINTDIPVVTASDNGGAVEIVGDNSVNSIFVDPFGTATTTLGLLNQSAIADVIRTLSWCGGPQVVVTQEKSDYTLIKGENFTGSGASYIKVNVASIALLPTQSRAESLIIERKPLDDVRIQQLVDEAISWAEDVALQVFIEPTRVVTEVDPDTLSFDAGTDIPTLTGVDYDKIVNAVMYKAPAAGHWIHWKCPYYPLICFEELYGQVANTRIVDIALEWVEVHEKTGWVELVPFNQEVAFKFIGLVWIESIRGPVPLPNFWNFTALVGFRKTPEVIIELIAKKAAMDILTIAGQAFRGGFSAQSVSREGVSESVSYTASAMYGIYSASIEDYRKWIHENLPKIKASFRGPNMWVM